jgi:hypothetical protein
MNCTRCDYALWNLRSRQCPECGLAFRPSEFRFATSAVRFCCPHCDKAYYGTGRDGHLSPRAFACVSCGADIDMDEMVLRPTEGVDERLTRPDLNPWLDDRCRLPARWVRTAVAGAVRPTWLMRATPEESSAGRAWGFALSTMLTLGIVLSALALLFFAAVGIFGGGFMVGTIVAMSFLPVLASLVGLLFWVLAAHGLLCATGPRRAGLGRTAQALCYTCGPNVLLFVPCIGFYFGWIGALWWVVAATCAIGAAQGVGWRRAALAGLAFPAVAGLTLGAMVVWWIVSMQSALAGAGGFAGPPGMTNNVNGVAQSLAAQQASGRWPMHGSALLLDGLIQPEVLIVPDSAAALGDVPLGSGTLADWAHLSASERLEVVISAAEALPEDVVAHRVGDFVFTYHGMPAPAPVPVLWIAVEAWDPASPGASWQTIVHVVQSDGSVVPLPAAILPRWLEMQNRRREALGLPTLPDPRTVTHEAPARSGGG